MNIQFTRFMQAKSLSSAVCNSLKINKLKKVVQKVQKIHECHRDR